MFPEFKAFSKISRLSREIIITEKIDGSNGIICIDEAMNIYAGSRKKWLWESGQDEIHNDNMGFGRWVKDNQEELKKLGPGFHYGEWWGLGIQRNYGLKEKHFSLFNTSRWADVSLRPKCCDVVPVLYQGLCNTISIDQVLTRLSNTGSVAAPGFMKPEGIVIYHTASRTMFKKTIENDEKGKEQ